MALCKNCNLATPKPNFQCDGCQGHLHFACVGMLESDVKILTRLKSKSIRLFCNECNSQILQFKDIKDLVGSLQTQIDSLKEQLNMHVNALKSTSIQQTLSDDNFEDVVREVEERNKRKRNIIIYGLPEPPTNAPDGDREAVTSLLDFLQPNIAATDLHVHRLGRIDPSNQRVRPIRVRMSDEKDVAVLVRSAKKLKDSQSFNRVYVSVDRTPRQQEHYKRIRLQLRERMDGGEKDLRIRYVNNVPKIVHLN